MVWSCGAEVWNSEPLSALSLWTDVNLPESDIPEKALSDADAVLSKVWSNSEPISEAFPVVMRVCFLIMLKRKGIHL